MQIKNLARIPLFSSAKAEIKEADFAVALASSRNRLSQLPVEESC